LTGPAVVPKSGLPATTSSTPSSLRSGTIANEVASKTPAAGATKVHSEAPVAPENAVIAGSPNSAAKPTVPTSTSGTPSPSRSEPPATDRPKKASENVFHVQME
jgi:hypothetical protein